MVNELNKYNKAYNAHYIAENKTLAEIAVIMNVTRQNVFKAFKRRGFELRSPVPRPAQWFDGKKFTLRNNGYYGLTTDDRIYMHRYVWEFINGPIPDGWDVHHMDEDKTNNEPLNLECLPKPEHTRLYSPCHNQYTKS